MYKIIILIIILPVVLDGCETWSITLREEHRLRVSENRVLRRTFGPKKNKVIGGWRKLHNEELRSSYYSPDIIKVIKSKRMKWAEHVACIGKISNKYKILFGKTEGKRQFGRPKYIWKDIKMGLRETGFGSVDWIYLTQYRDWWQANTFLHDFDIMNACHSKINPVKSNCTMEQENK
jgi:hypothetical protein